VDRRREGKAGERKKERNRKERERGRKGSGGVAPQKENEFSTHTTLTQIV
jgi:hypothetical protein